MELGWAFRVDLIEAREGHDLIASFDLRLNGGCPQKQHCGEGSFRRGLSCEPAVANTPSSRESELPGPEGECEECTTASTSVDFQSGTQTQRNSNI